MHARKTAIHRVAVEAKRIAGTALKACLEVARLADAVFVNKFCVFLAGLSCNLTVHTQIVDFL
jgi:hypothetical protein